MVRETKAAVRSLFPVKEHSITKALASSHGYGTSAAMWADEGGIRRRPFSETAFIQSMAASTNQLTARSVAAIFRGYRMQIVFTARPERPGDLETIYDVHIVVTAPDGHTLPASVRFRLPEFGSPEREHYRIDADYTHRVDDKYAVTRGRRGRQLLDTALQGGHWSGAVFIYHNGMRAAPEDCLRSVRSAMARIILSKFSSIVTVDVYKPDAYMEGAWRVVAQMGRAVHELLGGSEIVFDLPDFAPDHQIIGTYDREHMPAPGHGRFVDGVFAIDVHPSGGPGAPLMATATAEAIRERFIKAALTRFAEAGVTV